MAKNTKRIDGKDFHKNIATNSKSGAKANAQSLRNQGYHARVVPRKTKRFGTMYDVWKRKRGR
jgi:phage terminase large subunit-like protein